MATTRTPVPLGTNQYQAFVDLPYNFNNQFAVGNLGVLCNSAGVAAPTITTRNMVSAGTYGANVGAWTPAGGGEPIANPTDLGTGNYWRQRLEPANSVLIRPYLALFTSAAHVAYAAAAAAAGITATLSFILARSRGSPIDGLPAEFSCAFVGSVTVTNAAGTVGACKRLPANVAGTTGAQWCDDATINTDYTVGGIDVDREAAGGGLQIRFDQEGAEYLITYISALTAAAGAGWERSHL